MSDTAFDPYATLGVPKGADAKRLRAAYRRLSRQNHPDRSADPRANERMQRINRAWEIVSSPARRAQYDAHAARARGTGHWAGSRRSTQWAPPPPAWSTQNATARAYPPPPVTFDDRELPSWGAIAAVLLLVIVAGPFLLVALPVPFIGLFVLLAVGFLARSVE
jgi:curved DNA-binding protein CbpA